MATSYSVGVIGAGIMGRGIALAFALSGQQVRITDADLATAEASRERLRSDLATAMAAGVTGEAAEAVLSRILPVAGISQAVAGARLVIEAVPEQMEVKSHVWREISSAAPADAILGSNTSSFDIDALAALTADPGRVLGTHWFNPAHIVPCVEVVRGRQTTEQVVDDACELLRGLGKSPNVVGNSPGFIANRIQFAMLREALLCLEEGLASAEAIDQIVQTSFGGRLSVFGPLRLADMGGLDTYQSILRYLTIHLGERYTSPPVLDRLIEQNRLGLKTLGGISDYDTASAAALVARRDAALYRAFLTNPR